MHSQVTAEDYESWPEEQCAGLEIVDGLVVARPSPSKRHSRLARLFANALEAASGPALAVSTGVDLRLRDVPLLSRRPDVVLYDASLPDDALLRPQDCALVVEVMPPGSVTTDQTDKATEYATARIPRYWRIEHDRAEKVLSVFAYRLDRTTGTYASAGMYTGKMTVIDPVSVTIDLTSLL
jgi:Uma2 family endonuclease